MSPKVVEVWEDQGLSRVPLMKSAVRTSAEPQHGLVCLLILICLTLRESKSLQENTQKSA